MLGWIEDVLSFDLSGLECDHGSTLVPACCKANHRSQRKKVNLVQLQSAHHSTDSNTHSHKSL